LDLGADRGRQCEAHGAKTAGGDQRARRLVVVVLRLPHLVLPHVGHDDRIAASDAPDIVDDMRGIQVPVVGQVLDVADGHLTFHVRDVRQPGGSIDVDELRHPAGDNLANVA